MRRANWLRSLAGLLIAGAVLAPLLPLAAWSVSSNWFFPDLFPARLNWRAWAYLFSPAARTLPALGQGLLIGLAAMGLSLLVAVPAGRALGLHRFRGKRVVEFLILTPTIMPVLAVAMGIHLTFIRYGLADTIGGVILAHLVPTTPYAVMVMSSVFANYNPAYEEQARSLGAGPGQTFLHITLPAILPGMVVAGMFAFIISWGQYLLTLLIGGGRVITLPLLLFSFATSGDNAVTGALGVLYLLPTLLILLVTSRHLGTEETAIGGLGA